MSSTPNVDPATSISESTSSHSSSISQTIGPYRLEAEVTRHRAYILYRAYDTLYDRPVSLRVLPTQLAENSAIVRQFISIGRSAVRLHHPNLLEVYEAGQADGINYIAQEWVTGGTLAKRLQSRHHPYILYDAVTIIEQLAAALDYVHEQGFVHGALTAESVRFTTDNQPKLHDVGLLQLETLGDDSAYATSVSPFMAPEQARGEGNVDRQTDIYTLGVLAFLMLTGQTPFVAKNPLALLRKIIDDQPPVEELLGGVIPTNIAQALLRVLAKTPDGRYASARQFAHALLHGESSSEAERGDAADAQTVITVDASVAETVETITDPNQDDGTIDTPIIEVVPSAAPSYVPHIPPDYVPLQQEGRDHTVLPNQPSPRTTKHHPRKVPLFTLALLSSAALILSLVTAGRVAWNTFGQQMVDAALTPYAAVQMRLTPPLPPTMLTVADSSFFAGASARATDLLTTDQPFVVTMNGTRGTSTNAGVAQFTGSPPMVVIAPSNTPTDAPTDTPFPTDTPVPTVTATASNTLSPTVTPSPTETSTALPTSTATATAEPSLTLTPTASPTVSPTPSPTNSPSPTLTATATATTRPTLTPTATPEILADRTALAGRIAYTRWDPRTDRYDLIFYSVANGESWPIVRNRRQPDFAPNGQLIASGDGGFIDNLVLMDTNGENPVPISAHAEDAHPHWSPSGKQLVFNSTLVGDGRHRLYLHSEESFGERLTPMMFEAWELFGRYPVFLSNGQIAYNGCDVWENASNCGIFQVDTKGGQPEGVTTWPGDIPTDNLGSQILAMSDRNGNWDVYRIDPITGAAQQLTNSTGRDGLATASPDGDYIAFVSDRGGTWAIYTMRSDGSEERKLFELGGGFGNGDRYWLQERISWGR